MRKVLSVLPSKTFSLFSYQFAAVFTSCYPWESLEYVLLLLGEGGRRPDEGWLTSFGSSPSHPILLLLPRGEGTRCRLLLVVKSEKVRLGDRAAFNLLRRWQPLDRVGMNIAAGSRRRKCDHAGLLGLQFDVT